MNLLLVAAAIVLLIIVLLSISGRGYKSRMEAVQNPKVLIVAFEGDDEGLAMAKADKAVYTNYYRYVEGVKAHSLVTLQSTIDEMKPDLLHLVADVNSQGMLTDPENNQMPLSSIISYTVQKGGSYFILAKNIAREAFAKDTLKLPQQLQVNLLFTVDRKGRNFNSFLNQLFQRISGGEAPGISWVDLNQQDNREHPNIPDAVLTLGAPKVVLMKDKL